MWDKETQERLENANPEMLEMVVEGMKMRYEARRMELAADELKKKANKFLAPVLTAIGVDKFNVLGIGRLTFMTDVPNKSTSRDKMEKYLLEHGTSPELIAKARTAATTERTSEYQIKFEIAKD